MNAAPKQPAAVKRRTGMASQLLLFFWLGGVWSVGYLVEPALLQRLGGTAEAVSLALYLKQVMVALGIVCGVVLVWARGWRLGKQCWRDLQWQLIMAALLASAGYLYLLWLTPGTELESVLYGLISLLAIGVAVNYRGD